MASNPIKRPFRISPAVVLPTGDVLRSCSYFPPVWSVLTLRSHRGTTRRASGASWLAGSRGSSSSPRWFFRCVGFRRAGCGTCSYSCQALLLTLLTQVQWSAHRAHHGPPPTEDGGRAAGTFSTAVATSPEARKAARMPLYSAESDAATQAIRPWRRTMHPAGVGADAGGDRSAGRRIPRIALLEYETTDQSPKFTHFSQWRRKHGVALRRRSSHR